MKRIKLTGAVAACILALSAAGAAHAEERGRGMTARALLSGMLTAAIANSASVDQRGGGHAGAIVQNGEGNSAALRQYGRNNTGTINQDGSYNTACLVQLGRGLDGSVAQSGSNYSNGVLQTRRGVTEFPAELCYLGEEHRGYWQGRVRQAIRRAG